MSSKPEEEAECLMFGENIVIPVTIIFASDGDDDEEDYFPSVKKKERDRQPNAQATRRRSSLDREDSGDGGTSVAGVTCKDDNGRRIGGTGDESLRKARWRYPSDRLRRTDDGGGPRKLCPTSKLSPVNPENRPVKSEPSGTKDGRGLGSPAHGGRDFVCEECSYSTNNSYNLACHTRTHTGERPYRCSRCDRRFRTRSCLNRHAQAATCLQPAGGARRPAPRPKSEPQPLECQEEDCGYSTLSAYNLKVHRRVHTDERPYSCTRCDSAFRTQSHLYRHERCHRWQQERPARDPFCPSTCTD